MRRVIVVNAMSLDGYVAGPGGDLMRLPFGGGFDDYCAERLGTADTLLLGRNSFDMFRGFWPSVVDDDNATASQREISRRDNEIDKIVVSDRLEAQQTAPWTDTTRIIRRQDATEQVAELKRRTGGDILMFGSVTLWNDLLAHRLVDELHLIVGATAVGDGTPAFPGGHSASLSLIDVQHAEHSDNVLLRYSVPTPG